MFKTILKFISILLLLLTISGIGYFIIYPNYSEIQITVKAFNLTDIARNTSLKIFTKMAQQPVNDLIIRSKSEPIVENVTPEVLLRYQNEGNVIEYLEPLSTKLIIPSANIEGFVFDGSDSNTLLRGLWHFPLTPGPGKKGNVVVIAHRFDKMPPATDTFFNLDQVQVGDRIEIKQNNGNFTYIVTETKVVEENDRSILEQTSDYRITLVTCTPLWTDYQRLVVIGKLDRVYGDV